MQASRPELHARVPSLLDAVTYWYSLRAQGDKLDAGSDDVKKTQIAHFDLEPKTYDGDLESMTFDGEAVLPLSYACAVSSLDFVSSEYMYGVRLAVG